MEKLIYTYTLITILSLMAHRLSLIFIDRNVKTKLPPQFLYLQSSSILHKSYSTSSLSYPAAYFRKYFCGKNNYESIEIKINSKQQNQD